MARFCLPRVGTPSTLSGLIMFMLSDSSTKEIPPMIHCEQKLRSLYHWGIVLVALSTAAGCATNKRVRELEESLSGRMSTVENNLRRDIAANTGSINQTKSDLLDFKSAQGSTNQELDGKIIQAKTELNAELTNRDLAQTRARQEVETRLNTQITEAIQSLRGEISTARTQLLADLNRVDQRLTEEIARTKGDLNRRVDEETGLLKGEVDIVRAESASAHSQARRLSSAMRSALHRQRQVVLEQFHTLDGLTQTLEEILNPEGEGSKPENATVLFQRALASHREAVEKDDVDKYIQSLDFYKKGLAVMPEYVSGHYNAASILLELDRGQEAVPHLERVLSLAPNGIYAPSVRRILQEMGR